MLQLRCRLRRGHAVRVAASNYRILAAVLFYSYILTDVDILMLQIRMRYNIRRIASRNLTRKDDASISAFHQLPPAEIPARPDITFASPKFSTHFMA